MASVGSTAQDAAQMLMSWAQQTVHIELVECPSPSSRCPSHLFRETPSETWKKGLPIIQNMELRSPGLGPSSRPAENAGAHTSPWQPFSMLEHYHSTRADVNVEMVELQQEWETKGSIVSVYPFLHFPRQSFLALLRMG